MTPKEQLNKFIQDAKFKKFQKESANDITRNVTEQIVQGVVPAVEKAISQVGNAVSNAMEGVRFTPDIHVTTPSVEVPQITVPTPIVNYTPPAITIPDIKMPDEMNVKGWVSLMGVSLEKPLPVQIRDAEGRPVSFGGSTNILGGGVSGGKADYLTIKGFSQSAFAELTNPDGRIKVDAGTSAVTISDVVPVSQVSGHEWSVFATNLDIRDLDYTTDDVSVYQVSGANWSVSVVETATVNQLSGANWSVTASLDTTSVLYNSDNRLRVSVETGGSGLTDAELRASSVPVEQVSGSIWSVYAQDALTTVSATSLVNADNRLKVSVETGGSGLTDAELRATAVPVSQLSGAIWSVSAIGTVTVDGSGVTQPVSASNLDIRDLDNATDSIRVYQLSGASWSVEATATNLDIRDLANASDSVSNYQVSGHIWSVFATNPVDQGDAATALRVVIAGNSDASVYANNPVNQGDAATALRVVVAGNSDASVVVNSGTLTGITNTLTVNQLSGAIWSVTASNTSTIVVGPTVADAADDGSAPLKIGGIARTANPTAVAANDMVASTYDDLGRQVVRSIQLRDLINTAYVSVTSGTETTLLAATAGFFNDLIMIVGSNNCDAAVSVDIRSVTAGNIVNTLRIPANGTAGWTPPTPWPQDNQGRDWTVDGPDETGRTLTFSALFSKEV